ELTYTITLKNEGNQLLRGVSLKDIIANKVPSEVSVLNEGGGIRSANEILFFNDELKVGEKKIFTVVTKLNTLPQSGEVLNKVEVSYITPKN
ncbi:DUF11 domain-containing protein, partial [Vibrio vulnificus]|uniref:DUF11 domain-containing protein n=1 Tax=Vibrio vulnificus TaxID=672 RepID=UPI0019D45D65